MLVHLRRAGLILGSLAALGPLACDQPTGSTRPRSKTATPAPEVAVTPAPEPTPEPAKPRPILGQKTMEVRDAAKETAPGQGAVAVAPRITAKDPITLVGNAYVTAIGQTSIQNIKHAVDLYHATNDAYPKDYDEFMTQIIRGNNIALPTLPSYQKYGYDVPTHSLVILDYRGQ